MSPRSMNTILIRGGTIITLDPQRRILKDGAVLIEGTDIAYVGKLSALTTRARVGRVIDASGKLVLPGLINTHMHLEYSGIDRGIGDDLPLQAFVTERVRPSEAVATADDVYISTLLSCLEMIRTGTTCVCDTGGYQPEIVAKALVESGMRATVAHGSVDVSPPERPLLGSQNMTTEENLSRSEDLIRKWHGAAADRIRVRCGIRILPNASRELILGLDRISRMHGVGVNIHLSDTEEVVETARRMRGCTEIEYLDRLGVLDSRWMGVHMIWLSDHEVEIVRNRNMMVSHCPGAALHLGFGCTRAGRFAEMAAKGVTIALSQDSATANNSLDMFRSMNLVSIHKDMHADPTVFPPEKVLEMATIDGAKALLWEDKIGSLEPGKKADLILIDVTGANWVPMHEFSIVPNLVYSGDGRDVETVIIDGRIVMEKRRIKTIDAEAVLQKGQLASEELQKRSHVAISPRWTIE